MFTGIVEAIGAVLHLEPLPDGVSMRLAIQAPFAGELVLGESVSVQGTCLTVIDHDGDGFRADVSATTLSFTTLGMLVPGERVNLERSVTPATRLGGHWVQGHIDQTGTLTRIAMAGTAKNLWIHYPGKYRTLVLSKGSVAVNGVSLTVVEASPPDEEPWLQCTIIPHTQSTTTLGELQVGNRVNLEFDILGKYLQSLLEPYRRISQA